jgi:hypothetical protein
VLMGKVSGNSFRSGKGEDMVDRVRVRVKDLRF